MAKQADSTEEIEIHPIWVADGDCIAIKIKSKGKFLVIIYVSH